MAKISLRIPLSITAFAKEIGISRSAAWRLVKTGQLPYLEIGKRIILNRHDVDEFISKHTRVASNYGSLTAKIRNKAI